MICLLCHIITGVQYRAELVLRYQSDVCRLSSVRPLRIRAHDFDTGLFDCLEGDFFFRRNFYACCCAPVLFGVDSAASGLMSFWLALILTSIFLPLIWIFGFIGRLYMRKLFHMRTFIITDFCAWFFCHPCALVQEHKFMERTFSVKRSGAYDVEILPYTPTAAVVPAEQRQA